MVIAYERNGSQDVIMFEHNDDYVIQLRQECMVVEEYKIAREGDNGYEEAENLFDSFVCQINRQIFEALFREGFDDPFGGNHEKDTKDN